MNNGMTIVDACNEVGLPRSSYYDIVKNHGGDIIARSRPGEETTFRLLFTTPDRRPPPDEGASP